MQIDEGFKVTYGHGIADELVQLVDKPLVITMREIWPVVEDLFEGCKCQTHFVDTLEVEALNKLTDSLQGVHTVIGAGGGSVMDVAKYVSWRNQIPLYQIPTCISVNACFTHMIAVREGGRVRYVGDAVPRMVYVDYGLVRKAPPELNRAGLGDILSCYTGLFDWRLADRAGIEPQWDAALASRAEELLNAVRAVAPEICAVSETGIRTVMEVHKWVGAMCHEHGHPRFEEGSEHHFAYNLEYVTGKHILHGQLVCLGIYLMSMLQGQDWEGILNTITEAGVVIDPEQLGITWNEMRKVLLTLRDYVVAENLPYTIIHEKPIDDTFINNARERLNQSR
ncbi:MAG: iron-containing alcohol dehydrogenase [Firmicutes bacterium]|jgi:glycerol dehydrogenase-like iron-containing ADH family enzyme|nr:iron-containing alcohol dehydrogenase [Bacillota bacterium]